MTQYVKNLLLDREPLLITRELLIKLGCKPVPFENGKVSDKPLDPHPPMAMFVRAKGGDAMEQSSWYYWAVDKDAFSSECHRKD